MIPYVSAATFCKHKTHSSQEKMKSHFPFKFLPVVLHTSDQPCQHQLDETHKLNKQEFYSWCHKERHRNIAASHFGPEGTGISVRNVCHPMDLATLLDGCRLKRTEDTL